LISLIECDSLKWIGDYYLNTAIYNYQSSNYSVAVDYCYKAVSIFKELNDIEGVLRTKQILVQTLSYMNRDMEAAQVVVQNYQLIMSSTDSYNKADHINWLVKHYDVFYNATRDQAYLDTMKLLCEEGKLIANKFGNRSALLENLLSMDMTYYYQAEYKTGLKYLDSALMMANYKIDGKLLARIHLGRAWEYISMNNFKNAFVEHDSALYYFINYYQPYETSIGYTDGAEIYALAGDYKTAFGYYQRGIFIRDSVTSVSTSDQIAELEQKYNKEVNERRINDLSQENEIKTAKQKVSDLQLRSLIGIIIVVFLMIVIAIFIIRQRMMKQRQLKMEIEERLNRSRMNPHFFFNALTSLQNLSLDPKRQHEVSQYLGTYSKIMRLTLENTYHEMISIDEEIEYIEKYMELQKLRFPGKFDYKIIMDEKLDTYETQMPTMILQPFIENSIEHGFHDINYLGLIEINFMEVGEELRVVILDNGTKSNKESTHLGYPSRAIQIITDRLRLINEHRRSKARFEVLEGVDGKGY